MGQIPHCEKKEAGAEKPNLILFSPLENKELEIGNDLPDKGGKTAFRPFMLGMFLRVFFCQYSRK